MIQANLYAISCLDEHNLDFSAYSPENPKSFSCVLQLFVGPHNEGGEESFQLTHCTTQWLIENHSEEDVIVGKDLLIVFDYNYPRIRQWITRYIERCTGETWAEVAKQISCISRWEFEGEP